MSTALRDTMVRLSRLGPLPAPPLDRLTRMETVAAALAAGNSPDARATHDESWATVVARIDFNDLPATRPRDIRRAVNDIWADGARTAVAVPLVRHALAAARKSYDRALIVAYLRHFPWDHLEFDALSQAVAIAAARHDWAWCARGQRFRLWDPEEGPETLGAALLAAAAPLAELREAGFEGDLATGGFVVEALDALCEEAGDAHGARAERLGSQLVTLFVALGVGATAAMIAYALLNPWRDRAPSAEFRAMAGGLLVDWIGDPRLDTAAWDHVRARLRNRFGGRFDPDPIVAALKRWLTERSLKAFFAVVGRTTKDTRQWTAREAFWLGYLDAGAVENGWFALGASAEHAARAIREEAGISFARIGRSANVEPSHSALLMTIGDLTICEWSHTGSCRFWLRSDRAAPLLYKERYEGSALKTMVGGRGFATFPHQPSPTGWEAKFAGKVYAETGVTHPVHGRGRS